MERPCAVVDLACVCARSRKTQCLVCFGVAPGQTTTRFAYHVYTVKLWVKPTGGGGGGGVDIGSGSAGSAAVVDPEVH